MLYLDYIIYITFIILNWILIYKIIYMKTKITREMVIKEGFTHRGNATVIGGSKYSTNIDKAAKNAINAKNIDVFKMAEGFYNFLTIFADVFVKYPNKYVRMLGDMAKGPIEDIALQFKEIIKQSSEQADKNWQEIKDKLKLDIFVPFSIVDLTKMLTTLLDKLFGSLGDLLEPKNPK
jgi:hypothetical protein